MLLDIETALDSAVAHHQAGQIDLARAGYRAILTQDADQPDALNLLGLLEHDAGNVPDAIALLQRALTADPDFPEALTNLARARRTAGDAAEACNLARRAVELDPDLAEARLQLGLSLFDLKRYADAITPLAQAIDGLPALVEAHLALGNARMRTDDIAGALRAFEAALAINPNRVEALVNAGMCLLTQGQPLNAIAYQRRAIEAAPDDPIPHAAVALSLHQSGDVEASLAACQDALLLRPDHHDALVLRGTNLVALGRFAEAEASFRHALTKDPDSNSARAGLASIGIKAWDKADIAHLARQLDDRTVSSHDRAMAGFALGAVLDRDRRYDDAFAAYQAANDLVLRARQALGRGFDLPGLRQYIDWARATFDPILFEVTRNWGNPSDRPVFIVGMPRSGTTLVEQIAASHSKVFGAGELRSMPRLVTAMNDGPIHRSPLVWERDSIAEATEQYLDALSALAPGAARIVDKLPDNVQILGQIAVLFPNASIIVCRRDPRDVALSCYFQNFHDGSEWTFDLASCLARGREIDRLADHWSAALPGRIMEIQYESLVDNLEAESRRLIGFLGLDWEPACLDFQSTDRVVRTASQWQVRQPIYKGSAGRWRHYESHLRPVIESLPPQAEAPAPIWPSLGSAAHSLGLARALVVAGEIGAAEGAVRQAIEVQPDAADAHVLLGQIRIARDDHAAARTSFETALTLAPDSVDARTGLARTLSELFEYDAAARAWRAALEVAPDDPDCLLALGHVLFERGRFGQAAEPFRRLTELFPDNASAFDRLASVLVVNQNAGEAEAHARKAVALDPGKPAHHVRLGECLLILGRFKEAEECFRAALDLDPDAPAALAAFIRSAGTRGNGAAVQRLEAIYQDAGRTNADRSTAGYALARIHENSRDFDKAFETAAFANRLTREDRRARGHTYDRQEMQGIITGLIQTATPAHFAHFATSGDPSEAPVFIVGLPRSGTSLVEQILASHKQVYGRGETKDVEEAVTELNEAAQQAGRPVWLHSEVNAQAKALLGRMRARAPDAARIIDKLPDNIVFLGQIAVLFPNARVIFCRRDPRDTGLSCFFSNFTEGLEWTFDIGDVGYHAYQIERIALHWRHVLPLRMYEVHYETLVADLEGESRRLVDFLGLDWDPACLSFHTNTREVATASLMQVRQPIYASSVGRWRDYRKHLGPMVEALQGLVPGD